MKRNTLKALRAHLDQYGTKTGVIIIGASIPCAGEITASKGTPRDHGFIYNNTFSVFSNYSFWERIKLAFFPPKNSPFSSFKLPPPIK